MRLPNVKTTEDVDFAVIGIPFDTACSFRTGSRFGPAAIRDMSVTIRPYNINLGINAFDYLSGVDYGDIPVIPGYIEDTYEQIENELKPILDAGIIPICLGGDFYYIGELRAIAKIWSCCASPFRFPFDTIDYFSERNNHGTP